MVKSKRFQPIADLARDAERDAAKALGTALQQLEEGRRQLQQLQGYHDEYLRRLQQLGQQGINGQQLNEYRHFMRNLDNAIEAQKGAVAQAERVLEERKKFWFSKRGRSKALDSVLERYLESEQHQRDKREQREQDDRASRRGGDDGE